ncbi:hypothetical protein Tco_1276203, partial [Tanacetum coccineum]
SPTLLPDSTPPMRHAEDSVDSDTSGARSTPSDSTAPLSPDHPLTHASPTLVPFLRRTARMVVRVPPAMSPGLPASIAEVAAMSDSAFRKRFRSSYESLPSSSPLDLPSRKCYRGMSELVEEDKEEEDNEEEEHENIEESSDYDSESEGAEEEGPTAEDKDPAAGGEGLAARDESPAPVMETVMGEPLGLGYRALRCREIALGEGQMPSIFEVGQSSRFVPEPNKPKRVLALRQPILTTWIDPEDGIAYINVLAYPPPTPPVQTPPSLDCSSGSLPVSPAPSIIPSPISSPRIPLTIPSPVASLATTETEGFFTELGAQFEMQGGLIRHHTVRLGELSPAFLKGQTDTQKEALWHASSDMQRENQELRLQISEERRAQLDLAEIVDSMRRGQEPKGDV